MSEAVISIDSVALLEKDTNGDVYCVWAYPSVDADLEKILISRSNLSLDTIPLQFTYSKYKAHWIYIYTAVNNASEGEDAGMLNKRVSAFSICLIRNGFNPEKFLALARLQSQIYQASGDPVQILQCHLQVFTRGSYESGTLGKFVDADFDPRRAYLVTSIKDIVKMMGEDIVLLWDALLMKKRVVLYADKLGLLLKVVRALPLFVWHRQNWNILRPYITLTSLEEADLKSTGVYCAGSVDPVIKSREDLFDICVDINSRSVTVAEHAQADFTLGTFHNDLGQYLLTSADDPELGDQAIIKGLALKTKDLLTRLESWKDEDADGQSYITLEGLQQRKIPSNMHRFLFAVASAEGMTK
eukprot:TRINITY_DN6079_c0_g2_i4.p1 TRINITY_DN6079_c0_g2~~TRINITY_DN6079_c0_g2_i4.p1  ORF type:complete len:357 (-),score=58.92 TRINITY_DN6079_c0_g2_i4:108-1178(-)